MRPWRTKELNSVLGAVLKEFNMKMVPKGSLKKERLNTILILVTLANPIHKDVPGLERKCDLLLQLRSKKRDTCREYKDWIGPRRLVMGYKDFNKASLDSLLEFRNDMTCYTAHPDRDPKSRRFFGSKCY